MMGLFFPIFFRFICLKGSCATACALNVLTDASSKLLPPIAAYLSLLQTIRRVVSAFVALRVDATEQLHLKPLNLCLTLYLTRPPPLVLLPSSKVLLLPIEPFLALANRGEFPRSPTTLM